MSRRDPQLAVVDVGRDNLLIASLAVLLADELDQSIVDVRPTRKKETATGA